MKNKTSQSPVTISPDSKYVKNDSFILRKVAGSNVLISIGENIANFNGFIQLNETAAFLWEKLTEPQDVHSLSKALVTEFNVDPETARTDTEEYLAELIREEMVNQNV